MLLKFENMPKKFIKRDKKAAEKINFYIFSSNAQIYKLGIYTNLNVLEKLCIFGFQKYSCKSGHVYCIDIITKRLEILIFYFNRSVK